MTKSFLFGIATLTLIAGFLGPHAAATEPGPETPILALPPRELLPELVNYGASEVTVPDEVRRGSPARLQLHGEFPNTCYRPGPVDSQVLAQERSIVVTNYAYFFSSSWCLFVLKPFTQEVDLGKLPEGSYRILLNESTGARDVGVIRVVETP